MGLGLKNEEIIFFDTSPFIYFFEKHPDFYPKVLAIFDQLYDCNAQMITSMISYIELTTHPARLGKHDLVNKYRDYMTNSNRETGSAWGLEILDNFGNYLGKFWLIMPKTAEITTMLDGLVKDAA